MSGTVLRSDHGAFRLSATGSVLTAEAGVDGPPLMVGGRPVCLSIALGCGGASGRFSLLSSDGPVAWCPEGRPLSRAEWLPVALSVLAAAEAHVAANPRLLALAEAESLARSALTAPPVERALLRAQASAARRRTLAAVT